jgi:hypothetical protein
MDAEALRGIARAVRFARERLGRPAADHALRMFAQAVGRWAMTDPDLLTAVLLHEAIERGAADHDLLAARFGPRAAALVSAVTRDPRLPLERRERALAESMRRAPIEARLVMLLDIQDGLLHPPCPAEWLEWKIEETRALAPGLPERFQPLVAQIVALFHVHAQNGRPPPD